MAGFVLANGSMFSNQSNEGEIRKKLIEADLVDCMVALQGQLFYSTQIPACLWFLARDRKSGRFRDRRGEVLFIDARRMGVMVVSWPFFPWTSICRRTPEDGCFRDAETRDPGAG